MMDLEDKEYMRSKINNEGFHYCFMYYSSFNDIEDEKFHELRLAYIEAVKNLENYINE